MTFKELFLESVNWNSYADYHGSVLDLDKSMLDKKIKVKKAKHLGNHVFEIWYSYNGNDYRFTTIPEFERYGVELDMPHALELIGTDKIKEKTIEDTLNKAVKKFSY